MGVRKIDDGGREGSSTHQAVSPGGGMRGGSRSEAVWRSMGGEGRGP